MPDLSKNKQPAACGSWVSPLTAEAATGATIGLGGLAADGSTLYWLEARPAEQGRTVLVRRAGDGSIAEVTPAPINVASRVHEYGGGAYAVARARIVYSEKSDGSVWMVESDGRARQIVAVPGCRYADFAFIPGSDDIVCVREDHRNRKPTDPEAALVRLATGAEVEAAANAGAVLVKGPDFLSSPRVSPDGRQIAWLSWNHPDMPWDATRLHLARIGSEGISDATVVAGGERREAIVQPEWSPAGQLYFCTDRGDWWNIFGLSRDGTVEAVTRVTDGEIGGPHWVFGTSYFRFTAAGDMVALLSQRGRTRAVGVDVNTGRLHELDLPPVGGCPVPLEDGGLACVAAPDDAPPEIVIQRGGAIRRIRAAETKVLDAAYVSSAEAIPFPTADGEYAHAFYYAPVNAAFCPLPEEQPPLIVMIHGGPTGATTAGFSAPRQYWTTRGFAVADVNYRGSTGYGRAYRQRLEGNWGKVDVEDCVAVVQYLIGAGKADPKRVAIRGGSAGGFTVLAALISSDVFRAGASYYGVGDLMLLAAETHKFESRYLDRLVGRLPESEAVYRERSPIHHLDQLTAPVIFFQGLEDKVVPPSQARSMVEAMRQRGLPAAHYEFEGEAHGFRRAETQRRVLELELSFYGKIFDFRPAGLGDEAEIR